MSVSINGTNGLTFNDASVQNTAATGFGFKNRIINGAMMIDQRNAGASVTSGYSVDRWVYGASQASKFTYGQDSSAPTGFTNSLKYTVSSAVSVGSSDYFITTQYIEGYNTADLGWGAAGAAAVTVSFWVKSSVTGSFGGSLSNGGSTRSYPFSYTVNSANTWEYKTITIPGDVTGTWGKTNSYGIAVQFSLGVGSTYSGAANAWAATNYVNVTGSVNLVATAGATWQITGVQLEKGSTATSFDYRPYGTELALCQRYYSSFYVAQDNAGNSYLAQGITFPVPMRAMPTYGVITGAVQSNISTYNFNVGNFPAGQPTTGTTIQFITGSTARAWYFGNFSAAAEL